MPTIRWLVIPLLLAFLFTTCSGSGSQPPKPSGTFALKSPLEEDLEGQWEFDPNSGDLKVTVDGNQGWVAFRRNKQGQIVIPAIMGPGNPATIPTTEDHKGAKFSCTVGGMVFTGEIPIPGR